MQPTQTCAVQPIGRGGVCAQPGVIGKDAPGSLLKPVVNSSRRGTSLIGKGADGRADVEGRQDPAHRQAHRGVPGELEDFRIGEVIMQLGEEGIIHRLMVQGEHFGVPYRRLLAWGKVAFLIVRNQRDELLVDSLIPRQGIPEVESIRAVVDAGDPETD